MNILISTRRRTRSLPLYTLAQELDECCDHRAACRSHLIGSPSLKGTPNKTSQRTSIYSTTFLLFRNPRDSKFMFLWISAMFSPFGRIGEGGAVSFSMGITNGYL
ncbi:hypothetical protein ONS96_012416 [Cadophora gregata f. sp. sojae]|nr:hypothetical protein ONS96_012416 [Cadophora gregata f. sp. sojae]